MQKKFDLKSFNLYQFLKHQNAHNFHTPFFLADKDTYRHAHVNFPFRTFAYGLGVTYSGDGDTFKIGSTDYTVGAHCLTTIGPGLVCQWAGNYTAEHDTVYFTEELFRDIRTNAFLQSLSFFFHGGNHVIRLTEAQTAKMRSLFEVLKELKNDNEAVPGIVYSLLKLADSFHGAAHAASDGNRVNTGLGNGTGSIESNADHASGDAPAPPANRASSRISSKQKITRAFRKLVAEHFPEHKEVAHYATELNITPKYLSEILQAELGKPAKTFIDEHVLMEAKSLLKQTTFSVQEICYWLGFEDASHFTKWFRKQAGVTPTEYRKE
ncbi:hypothetical protein GCM10010967_32110 [Dyadobacter beijingensis]|uniref:HTH araC/xylS-type domain-containing protein n=1 Tax=Dyadobacter beijingensis TaxID=365489 RepID=A0ABQ2I1Z9_9BACT|nr:helix-turn-helix domain-containing protein [Dyadobacter beijingensis]GGM96143.1 hypothetical protein GCM10010967_32110 [Dyadobacter beijingensis]